MLTLAEAPTLASTPGLTAGGPLVRAPRRQNVSLLRRVGLAAAFLDVVGPLTAEEYRAIVFLSREIERLGVEKFLAIYPFIGRTEAQHAWNLMNPSVYKIAWVGARTHSALGMVGDGSTGYGNTGLARNVLPVTNAHVSLYVNQFNAVPFSQAMGVYNGVGAESRFVRGAGSYNYTVNSGSAYASTSEGIGLVQGGQAISGQIYIKVNAASAVTVASADSGAVPVSYMVGAASNGGSPASFSSDRIAFASIGSSLTTVEMSAFYAAVQAYQAALGRAV